MLTVYSKPACPFCNKAKNLLETKGIEFEVVDISKDSDSREFLLAQGFRSVPQIFTETELFVEGGYQGLSKLTDEELTTRLG